MSRPVNRLLSFIPPSVSVWLGWWGFSFSALHAFHATIVVVSLYVVKWTTGRVSVDRKCPTCSQLVAPIGYNWQGQWGLLFGIGFAAQIY